VVWRAEYAPFGRRLGGAPAIRARGAPAGFELALRLPGQYEDPETGLHYNDHRYYDPDTGRYLSPDPLGLAAGPNPYVYAGNDPLTRIDPSGLLLFAFDGTDNSDPPARRDDWSNVYKLSRAYSDGRVWYMAGVGRDDAASGIRTNGVDALNANTARARVDYLLGELDAFVSAPSSRASPIDVDVIGFSRGAAMARDFSNRVAERIRSGEFGRTGACVSLRFLGLWDTVAQFGADGIGNAGWRLAVPAEAAYAAQAVALNEHRTLFPAESIVGSPLAGVRIERGFVGAHSDIGGSYAEGDLSDVSLIWMHEQARLAGVRMFALTSEFARVTAPLLHDSNTDGTGDREFRYRNSWGWTFARPMQRIARVDGMQWSDTGRFIRRLPAPRNDVYGEPTIVGSVDMQSYSAWLAANYGVRVQWTP
jgi:RHS repeat-associated protein